MVPPKIGLEHLEATFIPIKMDRVTHPIGMTGKVAPQQNIWISGANNLCHDTPLSKYLQFRQTKFRMEISFQQATHFGSDENLTGVEEHPVGHPSELPGPRESPARYTVGKPFLEVVLMKCRDAKQRGDLSGDRCLTAGRRASDNDQQRPVRVHPATDSESGSGIRFAGTSLPRMMVIPSLPLTVRIVELGTPSRFAMCRAVSTCPGETWIVVSV